MKCCLYDREFIILMANGRWFSKIIMNLLHIIVKITHLKEMLYRQTLVFLVYIRADSINASITSRTHLSISFRSKIFDAY